MGQIVHASFAPLESSDMDSPAPDHNPEGAQPFMRLSAEEVSALSDTGLTDYIHGCAEQFLAAQRRWEDTGCFAAIGDRDGWWTAECEALRERSNRPHIVFALERRLGLA
jgi:hypothetical protein